MRPTAVTIGPLVQVSPSGTSARQLTAANPQTSNVNVSRPNWSVAAMIRRLLKREDQALNHGAELQPMIGTIIAMQWP